MKWLHRIARSKDAPAELTLLFDFTHTACFLAMFPELFVNFKEHWDPRRCTATTLPDWRHAAVAVEFHAYSRKRYWDVMYPMLTELRKRYGSANGSLRTATVVREPVHHTISAYHMWPPVIKVGRVKHARTLTEWLPRAVGLQAGALTLHSWPHVLRGFHSEKGCSQIDLATRRLASFDLVGVTECLFAFVRHVAHSFLWEARSAEQVLSIALAKKPHGVTKGGTLWREAREWQLDTLNASTSSKLHATAQCDRSLYLAVLQRRGVLSEPPSGPGVQLPLASC